MTRLLRLRAARGDQRDASGSALARTAGYARAQRIEALRSFLRDPERSRRARVDAPEGDERLLYLRVQSALRRLEGEEGRAAAKVERERADCGPARSSVHGLPVPRAHRETALQNAASQLLAILRPTFPDHSACT